MSTYEPQYMDKETKSLVDSMDQSKISVIKTIKQIQKLNHLGKMREIHELCQAVLECYVADK
jgi:hypothetical protein